MHGPCSQEAGEAVQSCVGVGLQGKTRQASKQASKKARQDDASRWTNHGEYQTRHIQGRLARLRLREIRRSVGGGTESTMSRPCLRRALPSCSLEPSGRPASPASSSGGQSGA